MYRTLLFVGAGYFSGSLLFARYFGRLCCKRDVTAESYDKNPGTFNAFQYGGFLCGTRAADMGLAFVLAAPVFGHILPAFHKFRGGKGIAVSFGCLLGLLPEVRPLLILACVFLFFSLIVRITPNYHRTFFTYLVSVIGMVLLVPDSAVSLGFTLVAALVICRFLYSPERKEAYKVGIAWNRRRPQHGRKSRS